MKKLKRILYSQNFLHSQKLVKKLVGSSSIGKNDLVLEIGSGKGVITQELIKQGKTVVAVEIDPHWYKYLHNKFSNNTNLSLYYGDFLRLPLPKTPYKVFANIPFSIEGKIIRKLIDANNPPEDCYLVVMKELAYRLAAPYKENQFSISHKPWFELSIPYNFRREDFTPFSNVDVSMIRFKKREIPLLKWGDKQKYQLFIEKYFKYGLPVYKTMMIKYGKNKTYKVLKQVGINKDMKPSYLSLEQWIILYETLIK